MSVDNYLVALLSNLTEIMVFWVKFHLVDHVDVHKYCLLQNLRLLIVHSFSVPSLAVNGRVGCKFTPTVVRRGQTDWLRRLLCGNPGGTSRAWKITPRHPTRRGPNGLPTVQCCQLSGWMCCAPAEMASWSVW